MNSLSGDAVVIGSGAGGAVMAHRLTEKGLKVILLEAGSYHKTESFTTDFWETMQHLFWDNGFQYAPGNPSIPFLQGRAVGGTTLINSAICWNLPRPIHEQWVREEGFSIAADEIEGEENKIKEDLHVVPVDSKIARGNNNAMQRGAERLGWEGRPIHRNEKDCQGSGRCLLGCPHGAKLSMEKTYVPWAMEKGMTLMADCEAKKVLIQKGRVMGVQALKTDLKARHKKGDLVHIKAPKVVVAAGVIQSPLILQRSRVPDPLGLIGSHLMAHPGVSTVGLFEERINLWNGATQGYEVTEFRPQGLKLETLAINPALFGVRVPGMGERLVALFERRAHMALWAAAAKAQSKGSVKGGRPLSPIRYRLLPEDLKLLVKGIQLNGEMMFAAGAKEIYPGIRGLPDVVYSVEELREVTSCEIKASQIFPVVTHLFGTCRLSVDPRLGVINNNFESHTVRGLYVADASIFPSNIGVNPQLAIMGLAAVAAKRVAVQ